VTVTEGLFIVVEGTDGTGSTTQAKLLVERLSSLTTAAVRFTCEPSTGPIGTMIRQVLSHRLVVQGKDGPRAPDWRTMALLFAADRMDHLDSVVLPILGEGGVVVSDRYVLSSLAYQSATSVEGEASLVWLRSINSRARVPDLTVVLTLPEHDAAMRRAGRAGEKELYEESSLQERLVTLYGRAKELLPGQDVVFVDAAGPISDVGELVWQAVARSSGAKLAGLVAG
jgi:dTMP kinase